MSSATQKEKGQPSTRPRRRVASSATSATAAASSSSSSSSSTSSSLEVPPTKRLKTAEELAAAALKKKHGNRPTAAYEQYSQRPAEKKPTLQTVVDQASKKKRKKSGSRTSDRTSGGGSQRTFFQRGEQKAVRGSYSKDHKDFDVFIDLCTKLDNHEITNRQLESLYQEGKTGNNAPRTIKNYVYKSGPHPAGRYKEMTRWLSSDETGRANRMLLSKEQEELMQRVLIHAHSYKKPFVEADIKQWTRLQLRKMKVGAQVANSRLDAWMDGFKRRCEQKGIPISAGATQQQSSGRAGVSTETITAFVLDVVRPELAEIKEEHGTALTLNDSGNSDEWWFDINKILQTAAALGPAGEERRQETPGERSAHTTVLSGFFGFESTPEERAASRAAASSSSSSSSSPSSSSSSPPQAPPQPPPAMPRTLKEFILNEAGDDGTYIIDDTEFAYLEKLSLDTWNSDHFSILPVMVIFVGKSGPDPEWTRLCISDRMLCTTTHDGWMDEASKLAWLKASIADKTNPYGERPTMPNFDGHYTNETVEYSITLEEALMCGLETPGHHTAVLQQMDQRGGPIQHANRIARALLRRYSRSGLVGNAEIMRIIEMSVAASHTPAICSHATTKVGWYEDESGELCYDPIGTIDPQAMKLMVKEEKEKEDSMADTTASSSSSSSSSSASSSSSNPYTAFIQSKGGTAELAASCCSELFGKGAALTNAEDPNEVDDEAVMSRKGRRCNKGAVISKQDWRNHKLGVEENKQKKENNKKTKKFEEYERVCSAVLEYEKIKDKDIKDMTAPQLKLFIEMRTTEKYKGPTLKAGILEIATQKKDDEVRLKEPSIPEGYAAWKQQQTAAAAAAAAAATAAQAPALPPAATPATTPAQPVPVVDIASMTTEQKAALLAQLQQSINMDSG